MGWRTRSDLPWSTYTLAQTGIASLGSKAARTSRIPNSMEVWWIAPDGSVSGAKWYS